MGGGNPGAAAVGSGYFPLTGPARRVAAARQELLEQCGVPGKCGTATLGFGGLGTPSVGLGIRDAGANCSFCPHSDG